MADMQVTTETSILHKHTIPEATVIAVLKLDVPNGSVLTQAQVMLVDGVRMLLLVTQEPTTQAGKLVTL
jgi:hypothetical protein